MFRRPSARRKGAHKQIELNLVPILDTMVTLIGFLLFTTSFMTIVSIESPFPTASTQEVEEQLKEKPLQLTLTLHSDNAEIWSPFEKIEAKHIPNAEPGKPNVPAIHSALVEIKQKFLEESKIVIVPTAATNYDTLIEVMDSIRGLDTSDPPIFRKNPQTGNDEALKLLFPDVIFGNLLGDT